MRRNWTMPVLLLVICILPSIAAAQAQHGLPASDVVKKSVNAIGYPVGKSTKVDLKGSELMSQGSGEAKVTAGSESPTLRQQSKMWRSRRHWEPSF